MNIVMLCKSHVNKKFLFILLPCAAIMNILQAEECMEIGQTASESSSVSINISISNVNVTKDGKVFFSIKNDLSCPIVCLQTGFAVTLVNHNGEAREFKLTSDFIYTRFREGVDIRGVHFLRGGDHHFSIASWKECSRREWLVTPRNDEQVFQKMLKQAKAIQFSYRIQSDERYRLENRYPNCFVPINFSSGWVILKKK